MPVLRIESNVLAWTIRLFKLSASCLWASACPSVTMLKAIALLLSSSHITNSHSFFISHINGHFLKKLSPILLKIRTLIQIYSLTLPSRKHTYLIINNTNIKTQNLLRVVFKEEHFLQEAFLWQSNALLVLFSKNSEKRTVLVFPSENMKLCIWERDKF